MFVRIGAAIYRWHHVYLIKEGEWVDTNDVLCSKTGNYDCSALGEGTNDTA